MYVRKNTYVGAALFLLQIPSPAIDFLYIPFPFYPVYVICMWFVCYLRNDVRENVNDLNCDDGSDGEKRGRKK